MAYVFDYLCVRFSGVGVLFLDAKKTDLEYVQIGG